MKNEKEYTVIHFQEGNIASFRELIALFAEVFEEPVEKEPGDYYLARLLGNKDFVAIAAMDGDRVLGGLTAYVMHLYNGEYAEAYIYDIAVKNDYQRKGIGRMLIDALAEYCRENKIKLMFVEAHEEDTNAVEFYHKAGGKAEKVVHFNFEV